MLKSKKFSIFLVSLTCILLSFSQIHCGGSSPENVEENTGVTMDPGTGTEVPLCSTDGSDLVAYGTYINTLDSDRVQVRIFRSDCTYCSETLDEGELNALEDGLWTSEYDDDESTTGEEIEIATGDIDYELSGDGSTLTVFEFDLTFTKDDSLTFTCAGESISD